MFYEPIDLINRESTPWPSLIANHYSPTNTLERIPIAHLIRNEPVGKGTGSVQMMILGFRREINAAPPSLVGRRRHIRDTIPAALRKQPTKHRPNLANCFWLELPSFHVRGVLFDILGQRPTRRLELLIARGKPGSYRVLMSDDLSKLLLGKAFLSYFEIDLVFVGFIRKSVISEVAAVGLAISS